MRKEKDALGEVLIPEDKYYGAQTQRACANFKVGREKFPVEFIRAHALVKKAAAEVNQKQGLLAPELARAIGEAADEVIANRASELMGGRLGEKSPVHPNDHVNMSQSTNDTVPTSIHVSAVIGIQERLVPALDELTAALQAKADEFSDLIKIGRTHLQDATPLTLGQEFSGYAAQLRQARAGILAVLPQLVELPIGGTAVGTGLNTQSGYDALMVAALSRLSGHEFRVAGNKFAAMGANDAVVATSGALKTLAAALMKIANDTAIAMAGSQGNFELNVFKPLFAALIIQSINLLADACVSFFEHCIAGIEANTERIDELVDNSLMLVTSLNRHIGYDKAAEIALKGWREGLTLKEAALFLGYVTEAQFDQWVRPEDMLGPSG
jgi:fumarate hydratase class II